MLPDAHAFLSLTQQAVLIRSAEITPSELVELCLSRIERYDGRLRAFITVTADAARAAARRAGDEIAAGGYRGPLHGIPVAIKDQMQVRGVRVTGGSRVYEDHVGSYDATVVQRLRAAGAVLVGTLNSHEFQIGPTMDFPYGTPRNPWNLGRSPGGSSSGSASATAAGFVSATLGGDTGGSNRGPAAACGVVGLKPTWSRVSRHGVFPFSWTHDCVGPLARTVADVAHVLRAIAGRDDRDPTSSHEPVPDFASLIEEPSLAGLRVGVVEETVRDDITGPEAIAAVRRASEVLRARGAELLDVSLPLMRETRFVSQALTKPEAVSYHRRNLLEHYERFDFNTRTGFMVGAILPAGLASLAQRARVVIAKQVTDALKNVDVLIGAASAGGAPPLTVRDPVTMKADARDKIYGVRTAQGQYTRIFSMAGVPAMAVPAGFDADGMPLSLHIAGRFFDEATVLRVGHAFQLDTDWHGRVPPLG